MNIIYILLAIIVLVHIFYTPSIQKKIMHNIVLTKRQKILNSILIWLLPFVWYYLVKDLITHDDQIMTKKRRKELLKKHHRDPYSHHTETPSSTGF